MNNWVYLKSLFAIAQTLRPPQGHKLLGAKSAYELFLHSWDRGKIGFLEEFKVLLLNRANRVLGLFTVSQGVVAGPIADPKVIFATALKCGNSSLILAHNHPSAGLKPSQEDLTSCYKLVDALRVFGDLLFESLIGNVVPYQYEVREEHGEGNLVCSR